MSLLARIGRTRWRIRVGLLILIVGSVAALGTPDEANAVSTSPITGAIGTGIDIITGGVGSSVVDGFGALLGKLFSWSAGIINRHLLAWLVSVPNYAISTSGGPNQQGSNLAELASTTSAMAFAMLAAVGTVSGARYWAAGLSGSGGFEALQGLARTVAAALFVVAWPWIFRHCADLTNAAAKGLLGSGTVLDDTSRLLGVAFGTTVAFNFLSIFIACFAGVLFLALLMCKIVASASTALVFTGMPLAIVLWVIPELAWIARAAMRAFAVVLAIPMIWSLCFATFAALSVDALSLKGAGSVADSLILPLVALALLWILVTLPRMLARAALLGGFSGGAFVSRTASFVGARRIDAALPGRGSGATSGSGGSSNGRSGPSSQGQQASGARTGVTVAAATAVAGPAGTAAGTGSSAAGGSSGAGAGAKVASPAMSRATPTTSPTPVAPRGATSGLPPASWKEIQDRVPAETERAQARRESTTRQDVASAMRDLRPDVQRAIHSLSTAKEGRITGEMVHQASRSGLSADEQAAFRTLAAATPEVRMQGLSDVLGSLSTQAGDSSAVTPRDTGGPLGSPPASAEDLTQPDVRDQQAPGSS